MRSRPPRRFAVLTLVVVLGLELLYLVAANGFLRSGWGRHVLNRRPETLAVEWRSAWTWLPGVVHVRGLRIGGAGRRAEWRTVVDRGRMVVLLPSLLSRHFRVVKGGAEGAAVQIRTLPPPDTPRPAPRRRPWRVSLDRLTVSSLTLLRLNDLELRGAGRTAGWAHFQVRGPMELGLTSLAFDDGQLLDGGETAADALWLAGRLQVAPFVVGEDTVQDLLAGLSGRIELEAQAEGLGFLSGYLEAVPWLSLGGRGHLVADLTSETGWLAPGSRLTLEGPTLEADLFGLTARGEGRLVGEVPAGAGHTELAVRLPTFSVSRPLDGARLLEGERLEVVVTNDSNAIDRPAQGVSLALTVPPARVPDLAQLSRYLPAAAEVRLTGGSAVLEASLDYRAAARTGSGHLRLQGSQVEALFRDVELRADLDLDARLSDVRLDDGSFDISGSRLEIDEVRLLEQGRLRDRDWWGRLRLSEGMLVKALGDAAAPAVLDARLEAELRDTGPLVALLERHVPRLAWIDGLLTVHNVRGSSRLLLRGPRLALRDLEVTGGKKERLELLGQLELAELDDPTGLLFARWGKLSAAVSLAPNERDWKLTGSRRWYEERAAAHPAAPRTPVRVP